MNFSHNSHLVASPIWFIAAELTKNNGDWTPLWCMTMFLMSAIAAFLGMLPRKKT
ncbi:MAG: hypothetical protein KJ890_07150 [Gammaproteobacteria bacterium]|nr:hypothetical protein [Gammaproteobacteria bacterium]MBU0801636.1 hypothetical protein [Alphaproteobacteria bacterium]MBU1805227.1 hypothetical protein [Gammaproteobacteria bacterium]